MNTNKHEEKSATESTSLWDRELTEIIIQVGGL